MRRVFLLVVVMVLLAQVCAVWAAAPIILRMGHDSPQGHPYDEGLRKAAQVLADKTGGAVQLQIFPASQLGSQQEQMMATIQGTQEMWMANPSWLGSYYPKVGILEAAFLFRDLAHMYKAMKGPIGQELLGVLPEKVGVRVVDIWYLGMRHLTLTDKPAYKPEDLKGVKVRAPNAQIYIENVRALGASPTPMGINEVYLALKTGVVDGQENPLTNIDSFKFYEVCKYLVLSGHQVGPIVPIINEKVWQKLAPEHRQALLDAFKAGGELNDKIVLDKEATLVDKFKAAGMVVVEPDRDAFLKAACEYLPKKFESVWGAGLYEAIQSLK